MDRDELLDEIIVETKMLHNDTTRIKTTHGLRNYGRSDDSWIAKNIGTNGLLMNTHINIFLKLLDHIWTNWSMHHCKVSNPPLSKNT